VPGVAVATAGRARLGTGSGISFARLDRRRAGEDRLRLFCPCRRPGQELSGGAAVGEASVVVRGVGIGMGQKRGQAAEELQRIEVPSLVVLHVLTHEFHHKGQICTAAPAMGYAPQDLDLF
jgi:hypothetical protein